MDNGQTETVTLEAAKERFLNPPEEARPSLGGGVYWLMAGAFAAGLLIGTPSRLARIARTSIHAAASPAVQRAALLLLLRAARKPKG